MMRLSLVIFFLVSVQSSFAISKKYYEDKIHYRTVFGQCPSKVVGRLTLTLIKEFERNRSLLDIKKKIVNEKLEEKYYLSSYKIDYNPLEKMIKFQYDCPKALMKVQIYKKDGEEFYTAILVDNGKLYDPTYEVLLRAEKKITKELPHMAIPASLINSNVHMKLTSLLNGLGEKFNKRVSEVILNENEELTIILSIGRKPSSAFLGKEYWTEKIEKLNNIVDYMSEKKTIPSVINLTNSKKVVVKFPDQV
jgi:hypothetical protein